MSRILSRQEELFAAALAQPPGERGVFLAKACAADVDLLAHLVALVAAHEDADSLSGLSPTRAPGRIQSGGVNAVGHILGNGSAGPLSDAKAGDTIGHYKLLQKVGEGGCGMVWMAEQQEPVRRRVALKVIKLGMDTKAVVARFEAERQALAMMDHPNIAKVHDAGATEAGRPYFVMELVRGIPITKYCDENQLTPAARLELFVKVCLAVQHAHQKGIIHRDLKPSNILVTVNDGQPTPKVIDFGIAKATQGRLTDATVFTAFDQFIGTPAYMSPEQAEMSSLDVDTRSDIYSLGILLYELLTGMPPFDPKAFARAGVAEIRHHLRTDEPPRPSARVRTLGPEERTTLARQRGTVWGELSVLLRGDLDWIVMRCIEKDRTRRYETASALAADIQRHLRHEPVMARPPGSVYLLQKLIRRHRVGFAAASVVIAVIVIGALATAAQATRALRAERTQNELREAARQAQSREANARRLAEEEAQRASKQEWVRQRMLPEIRRLVAAKDIFGAFAEAIEAEKVLPNDPTFAELWPRIANVASFDSTPPGADLYIKPYDNPSLDWRHVGTTPLKNVRVPNEPMRLLVKKDGYVQLERAGQPRGGSHNYILELIDAVPPGMIRIPAREQGVQAVILANGVRTRETPPLESYFMDRHEVTNREFKAFVDQGGYATRRWWRHSFVRDGVELSWAEAIASFKDSTGKPGPATWRGGTFVTGQEDHPVSGISWFEAAAYAEFVGKRLPSIFHWRGAATGWPERIVRTGNFSGRGTIIVGSSQSMNHYGNYDMAGNVREWCWNEAGEGKRYILGGGWQDPLYMYVHEDAQSAFERSSHNGFRCIKLSHDTYLPEGVDDPVQVSREFSNEQPVSDEIFRAYEKLFAYHATPLNAQVESMDESSSLWRRERVSIMAAYGNERVPVYIFHPRNVTPPYQAVVVFPGTGAFNNRRELARQDVSDFVVRSGRAVVLPVYQGLYERGEGGRENYIDAANIYPDLVIQWSKDLGRTLDYLATRQEIQSDNIAFLGLSLGAIMGSVLPAVEPRIRAIVLVGGGMKVGLQGAPHVEQANFAPRITVPTLMINGRADFIFTEPSQRRLFSLLGASPENKRHVLMDAGHIVSGEIIERETLAWFDRYLGAPK